ncbi:MAG: GIY-YIG nuclease family protein [Terriglobales bacterium]
MDLNNLLRAKNIDPEQVLVFRHSPTEPQLKKVFPWLAAERPDLFNAYQQSQGAKLEKAMTAGKAHYVASFIGHTPGRALFVGLYSIAGSSPLTYREYWSVPANVELKEKFGMAGMEDDRPSCLWFDLSLMDMFADWKGKLIVRWPPPEISWWRWAAKNEIPVHAILEESALDTDAGLRKWNEIELSWDDLHVMPERWKSKLREWRGVYYIFDSSDGKGYVGSAYGEENMLGRWLGYKSSGHGDNVRLRERDPKNFQFTILQLMSPNEDAGKVIQLESTWKVRLHTRTHGLNAN